MAQTTTVEGFDECIKAIRELEQEYPRTVFGRALRAGAKVILASLVSLAPVRSGDTRGALKVRAGKRRKNFQSMVAGIPEGFFKGDQFYAGFVNYGWKTGKRGSANRRQIPGEHWAEIGFDDVKDAALARVTQVLKEHVEKLKAK